MSSFFLGMGRRGRNIFIGLPNTVRTGFLRMILVRFVENEIYLKINKLHLNVNLNSKFTHLIKVNIIFMIKDNPSL